MKRKEIYGTSGTRMTVRFFGGYDFTADDAQSRYLAEAGYAKGVPMGGDLRSPPRRQGADVPRRRDEGSAGRQPRPHPDRQGLARHGRQGAGEGLRRRLGRADRKPGKDGKLPPVGDTVDVATRHLDQHDRRRRTGGVWKDPDFDPAQRAFYYARVIEIPTPRWTAYDQVRFGMKMSPDVPMKQQERAWTSPIWYSPT